MLLYIITISFCLGFACTDDTVCLQYYGSCYYCIIPTQSCQYDATKCIPCNADIDCATSHGSCYYCMNSICYYQKPLCTGLDCAAKSDCTPFGECYQCMSNQCKYDQTIVGCSLDQCSGDANCTAILSTCFKCNIFKTCEYSASSCTNFDCEYQSDCEYLGTCYRCYNRKCIHNASECSKFDCAFDSDCSMLGSCFYCNNIEHICRSNSSICIENDCIINSDCLKIGSCMQCESVHNRYQCIANKSCRCNSSRKCSICHSCINEECIFSAKYCWMVISIACGGAILLFSGMLISIGCACKFFKRANIAKVFPENKIHDFKTPSLDGNEHVGAKLKDVKLEDIN